MSSFDLFCADLSMNRPGFALLHYDEESKTVKVEKKSNVNNSGNKDKGKHRKPHGQILAEIAHEIRGYMQQWPDAIWVREKA